MSKAKTFIATLLAIFTPALLMAGGDVLRKGANNTPNSKYGEVSYPLNMCYDGTYWDMLTCTDGDMDVNVDQVGGVDVIDDDAAFTPGTTPVLMSGFEYDDTAPDSVDEGDGGAARMSSNRNQYVQIRDGAGNERGANVTAAGEVEIDIAAQSLTAVAVSADSNANATGNRIWVYSDMDMVAGTATNVNGGNRDAGTQTVTLADDDPAVTSLATLDNSIKADDAGFTPESDSVSVCGFEYDDTAPDSVDEGDAGAARMSSNRSVYTQIRDGAGNERGANVDASGQLSVVEANSASIQTAVEIVDDWDNGSDQASVDIAAQSLTAVKVSDDGSANSETNPMYHQPVYPSFDDDAAGNCVSITAASVQFTMPGNDAYEVCAHGGEAYILCGANPTATTTVNTGYSFRVGDGQCIGPYEIASAKCAVIGAVAAGAVCFQALDYN